MRDDAQLQDSREPTLEEYAERWGVAISSAYRLLHEFRAALSVPYPGELCDLLWEGMPRWPSKRPVEPRWLLAVEIVEA